MQCKGMGLLARFLLVALSTRQALVPFAESCGEDVDALLARVEEESIQEQLAAEQDQEQEREEGDGNGDGDGDGHGAGEGGDEGDELGQDAPFSSSYQEEEQTLV